MARTGTLRVMGRILGGLTGDRDVELAIPITNGGLLHTLLTLTTGGVTLALPATAVVVVFAPPTGNATPWGLAATLGGAVVPMHLTSPSVVSVPAGTTLYPASTSGTLTGLEVWAS